MPHIFSSPPGTSLRPKTYQTKSDVCFPASFSFFFLSFFSLLSGMEWGRAGGGFFLSGRRSRCRSLQGMETGSETVRVYGYEYGQDMDVEVV